MNLPTGMAKQQTGILKEHNLETGELKIYSQFISGGFLIYAGVEKDARAAQALEESIRKAERAGYLAALKNKCGEFSREIAALDLG